MCSRILATLVSRRGRGYWTKVQCQWIKEYRKKHIVFHVVCFSIWDSERRVSVYAGRFQRDEEQAAEAVSHGLRARGRHALLDDLIRPQQHRRRDRLAERLGSLHVDDQLELRGLFDGQVGGFGAFEDLVHVGGTAPSLA